MKQRIAYSKLAAGAMRAMYGVQEYVNHSGLDPKLLELVKMRASQLNGCAYCLDMHSQDARQLGETEQRLYVLPAWREAPFYSPRERAALAWTEAVTLVADSHVPDEVYEEARREFNEQEMIDLTMAIIAINGWNRLAISFRSQAGTYHPAAKPVAQEAS